MGVYLNNYIFRYVFDKFSVSVSWLYLSAFAGNITGVFQNVGKGMNDIGHQIQQNLIGNNNLDRRYGIIDI
jgi:hypothetical protein